MGNKTSSKMKDNEPQEDVQKLLILGAGSTGKDTIWHLMCQRFTKRYNNQQTRRNFIKWIKIGILSNVRELLIGMMNHGISIDIFENAEKILKIERVLEEDWNEENLKIICKLWNEPIFRSTFYSHGHLFHLNENFPYWMNQLKRIQEEDYTPTFQDILCTQIKTTGVVETSFVEKNVTFQLCNVGGIRRERRKWIHVFLDVEAVLFVVALSDFDQVLEEDETADKMVESLHLWSEVVHSKWLSRKKFYLIFTKVDIFVEKLCRKSINVCPLFKDYPIQEFKPIQMEYPLPLGLKIKRIKEKNEEEIIKFPNNILDLSNDEWISIFEFLNLQNIVTLSLVCKKFYELSKSNRLWRTLCIQNRITDEQMEECFKKFNIPEKEKYKWYYKNGVQSYQKILNTVIETFIEEVNKEALHRVKVLVLKGLDVDDATTKLESLIHDLIKKYSDFS